MLPTSRRILRARAMTSRPAGVIAAKLLPLRVKSCTPSSASSCFSCLLMPGWLVNSRSAADVMFKPLSAMPTRYLSCFSVTPRMPPKMKRPLPRASRRPSAAYNHRLDRGVNEAPVISRGYKPRRTCCCWAVRGRGIVPRTGPSPMQHLPLFADLAQSRRPRRRRRRRGRAPRDAAARGQGGRHGPGTGALGAPGRARGRRRSSRTSRSLCRPTRSSPIGSSSRRPTTGPSTRPSPRRPLAAKRFCNVVDDQALCTFIMPAIVDRSPVTIAIGSSGLSPVLARWIKGVIETLLPARLGALAELAGRWRQRVREQVADRDRAPPLLGARRHGRRRGARVRGPRRRRRARARERALELGQRRRRAARRSVSRRRRPRRHRSDHDPRPPIARDGRRRALRPARRAPSSCSTRAATPSSSASARRRAGRRSRRSS